MPSPLELNLVEFHLVMRKHVSKVYEFDTDHALKAHCSISMTILP